MSSALGNAFLQKLLRVAQHITRADRGMVVDSELNVIEAINIDTAEYESDDFTGFQCIRQAIDANEAQITNNVFIDPANAPTTNTNFSNLRAVVVIPVPDMGAVYLDQRIRNGIIPKKTVEKLYVLAQQAIRDNLTERSEEELVELFRRL